MTTFPKKIVEKLQVVPGGVTNLVKKGESNFRPDVPPPQPPDNEYGDGFVFSTHNNDPVAGELPIMVMMVVLDNSWKLVDADTDILVADGLGNRVDGVEIQQSGAGESEPGIPNATEAMVALTQTGSSDKKYRLTGNIMMMGIGGLSQMSPGPATMSVSEGSVGQVIIHQWLARVVQCVFSLADINLQVPRYLSPDIVSTQHMFAFSNLFNQDISTWNTSRVMNMTTMFMNATSFDQDISDWDVSNVTNMDSMFESASQFNQDLSPWCVRKILTKPSGFDNQASRWVKSRPSWGTCPAEEEEPPYVPPVEEEVDDDTVIKAFDYALIRYRWLPSGGTDLDTRTYMSVPNRTGRKVGWSRLKNDNEYLVWNEDNTGSGVESVLIDIDKIHVDYPGEQIIELKMDGFWYSQVESGKLDIEFATFKGGKMVASGYDWINEGGLAIQILKLGVDTLVQQSSDIDGENLATLRYDTLLKKGTLVARDGPSIGDGGEEEPEVPVTPPEGSGNGPDGTVDPSNPVYPDSEQGFTFSVEIRDNDGGSVPFDIRLVKVAPGWKVYSGNTLILSADKIHPQVSANVSMGDVTLTFNIPRKDIKTYTIIADAPSLAFEVTQTSFSGQDIVINRFSNTILNYQFSVTDATLRVPTVLPSYITSTSNMFLGANQFNQDISMWDTSNVTNMSGMFDNAETFNQDISGWDVSNVTNMMFMFRYAHKFNQPIGSWNVKNVTNMKSMFESAPAFNQDLSKWCVSKIATKPDRFDYSAHSLYTSHLPVWGTCPVAYPPGIPLEFNLTTPDDSTQTAPLTFELEEWGTGWALYEDDVLISNSETMGPGVSHSMGGFNRQIIKIDRDNFANKTVNYKMFVNNEHLNVSRGFNESSSIYPSVEVLSFSDTSRRQSLRFAWTDMTVPTVLPQNINSTVTMFDGCQRFNQDISMWDTSYVENMSVMFRNCISFNQPIGGWDVRNVTDITEMFAGCSSFNQDISGWDVSQVKRIQGTFDGASVFNSDISGWGLDSAIDYQNAFKNAIAFNQDISGWKTSNVLYMSQMFSGAHSFNQDISKWDVKQVQHMDEMFYDARSFNQDLSGWCVTNIPSKPNLFSDGAVAWTKPKPVWGTCPVIVEKTIQFDVDNTANDYVSVFEIQALSSDSFNISRDGQAIYVSGPIASADEITQSNVWPNKTVTIQVPPRTIRSYSVSSANGLPKFVLATNASNGNVANIHIKSFDAKTPHYQFNVYGWPLYVEDTLPATVTSAYMMFYGCKVFNQDISSWDVSNVTNMEYMFYNAETFNHNLAGWNVAHIPSEPTGFSTGASMWVKPKPIWGTTGGSTPPTEPTPFNFTTSNRMSSNPLPVALRVVSSGQAWSLIDVDTQAVIHEVAAGNTPGQTEVLYLDELGSGAERSYVIEGTASEVSLSIDDESRSDGFIKVESFSGDINQYKYDVKNADITVPLLLPSNVTNTDFMFQGCYNFNQDITGWDTSAITSMEGMFSGCTSFNQEIGNWDVSNVTNMNSMFKGCVIFNGDISSWETRALENMYAMFSDCEAFNQNLNDWNVSNVTDMGMLFSNCRVFNQPLDNWDTSSCVVFGSCFAGAHVFNQNINNWDVTNATDLNHVFSSALAFNQPLSNWVIPKLYSLESTFMNAASFNQDISNWNVSMVSDMSYMFQGATVFNKPLNTWDTSSLSYANGMFDGAHNFNQPLDNWVTSSLSRMSTMFSEATSFNQDLSSWCVTNFDAAPHNFSSGCLDWVESKPIWGTCDDEPARTFNFTFTSGSSVATGAKIRMLVRNLQGGWELYRNGVLVSSRTVTDARVQATPSSYAGLAILIEPVTSSVENYELKLTADALELGYTANDGNNHSLAVTQFSNGIALNEFALYKVALTVPETLPTYVKSLAGMFRGSDNFNQNINSWDVSHVKDFSECFKDCTIFNQPLDTWNITSSNSIVSMFENCKAFNQDISSWDITGKPRLLKMFNGCTSFNQSLNAWDVSDVWSFESMFYGCSSLNQDFNDWTINTSTKVNMYAMFSECSVFNGDITTWNTSMVGTTERMFTGCNAFNRDISGWNTATFSNMEYMFQNATSFNQDLSPWNVVKFPTIPYEFARDTPAWTLPKPVWGTTGVAPLKSTFVAVDISGASGTFLTLSKNDGPWTTFNLADPEFDVAAFQSFVITGKDGSSFAFLDWPAPLKPEDANGSDKTPGIGGLVSPAGMVAPGHPDGYSFVDGVYVPPILLSAPVQTRKELNTLRIKQSAGAPAGYDIFFTIPGAVEGGILKVVSTVVFPFTDDNIYAPPL